ncbi:MAG: DUF2079 domain-containing protein [Hominimerdicola sp.]
MKEKLKKLQGELQNIFLSLLFGYFLSNIYLLIFNKSAVDANQKFYADSVVLSELLVLTLSFGLVCFSLHTAMKASVPWLLTFSAFSYIMVFEWKLQGKSPYVCFVFIALALVFVLKCCPDIEFGKFISEKIKKIGVKRVEIFFVVVVSLIFFWFFSYGTVKRYEGYGSSCFDFGLFAQMFEYMAKTGIQYSTLERNELLTHFTVHFSPIFYLMLPFYMIWRTPQCLLVLQALVVISGVIPAYKLCKMFGLRRFETVMACIVYVSFPAFTSAGYYDIHENVFLAPLILWLMYFMRKENMVATVVSTLLVLCVKEDAGFYLVFAGLYWLFSYKKKRIGAVVLSLGALGFVLTNMFINIYGEGIKANRFDVFITNQDAGLLGVIINVIKNPAYFMGMLLSPEKILFVILMTLPLLFMCFKLRNWGDLFLLAPFLIINLSTEYTYQFSIDFQYIYGSGPLLYYLYLKNISACENRRKLLVVSAMSSVLIWNFAVSGKYQLYVESAKNTEPINAANQCIESLDTTAVVYADTYISPALYRFENVYLLDNADVSDADYILLDTRNSNYKENLEKYINEFPFYEEHGYVAVMSRE